MTFKNHKFEPKGILGFDREKRRADVSDETESSRSWGDA